MTDKETTETIMKTETETKRNTISVGRKRTGLQGSFYERFVTIEAETMKEAKEIFDHIDDKITKEEKSERRRDKKSKYSQ